MGSTSQARSARSICRSGVEVVGRTGPRARWRIASISHGTLLGKGQKDLFCYPCRICLTVVGQTVTQALATVARGKRVWNILLLLASPTIRARHTKQRIGTASRSTECAHSAGRTAHVYRSRERAGSKSMSGAMSTLQAMGLVRLVRKALQQCKLKSCIEGQSSARCKPKMTRVPLIHRRTQTEDTGTVTRVESIGRTGRFVEQITSSVCWAGV